MSTSPSLETLSHPSSLDEADGLLSLHRAGLEAIRPEPRLTVSEWADLYRQLPSTAAEPGRWRTHRTPYLRDIMDALSPSNPAEFVVFMKGAQVGATEAGSNWLGYIIQNAPGLMLMVYPGLSEVKRNTSTRINPLIESTPALRSRVAEPRSRDGGNSIFRKKFPGGELVMTGANSAVGLRSTPARYLFLDEIDGYPSDADNEGDPVDLAVQRTVTFQTRRKIFQVSTPTVDGRSRIKKAYDETDQRKFFVPCRHCGEYSWLQWVQIKWPPGEPEKAAWICPECGGIHEEHDKKRLLEEGEWRAMAPGDGLLVGFHLSALYSPWEKWGDIAGQFEKVKKDPNRLKVWVNVKLGEVWQEKGEAPEWERIYAHRESYPVGTVPRGALLLTAGVDVQPDRIEMEVVGWGRDQQSWSVDYRILEGDTTKLESPVWSQLSILLSETWKHESGVEMGLARMAIDDGFASQIVRSWGRQHPGGQLLLIRGQPKATVPVGRPVAVDINRAGKRIARGIRYWPVGVDMLKTELYGWLGMNPPTVEDLSDGAEYPPGYCHFPEYGEEHFRQLTAEEIRKRVTRGYTVYEWAKTRDRNEALDCRIYARAAAIQYGVMRFKESFWDTLAAQFADPEEAPADVSPAPAQPTTHRPAGRRRRSVRSSYFR